MYYRFLRILPGVQFDSSASPDFRRNVEWTARQFLIVQFETDWMIRTNWLGLN